MAPATITFLWLIILSVSVCSLLLGIFYLRNKEKMAMIERGMQPRERERNQPQPFTTLKIGSLFAGTGFGLLLAYLIHAFGLNNLDKDNIFALYFAMIFLGGGIGFLICYRLEMKYWNNKNDSQIDA